MINEVKMEVKMEVIEGSKNGQERLHHICPF